MNKHFFVIFYIFSGTLSMSHAQIYKTISQQVHFSPENNEIPAEQAALLSVFLDITNQMANCKYIIQPQTDKLSISSYKKAAEDRAKAIQNFLIQRSVPLENIVMLEPEQSRPYDDTDHAGRRQYKVVIQGNFTYPIPPASIAAQSDTLQEDSNPTAESSENLASKLVFSKPKKREEYEKENDMIIQDIYAEWDIEPQIFYIHPDRDTLLETIRGLYIYIPSFSFQTKGSATMGKEIALIVKEYAKKSDMATYYLASNDHKQHLSPFGIYRFEASSNDNPLEVKLDKKLYLLFPTILAAPNVQLYLGKRTDSTYQMDWECVSMGEGNFKTEIPENWKISDTWWRSQEKEESIHLQQLRTRLGINRPQGILLLNTLYAQREFEQKRKKDKNTAPSLAENTAFVFSASSIDKLLMLGANTSSEPDATLYVQYPNANNTVFQLISKSDKSVYYPESISDDEFHYAFKVSKKDQYTLLGMRYMKNKVQLSLQPIEIENEKTEVKFIPFTEYKDKKEARKALRILDY